MAHGGACPAPRTPHWIQAAAPGQETISAGKVWGRYLNVSSPNRFCLCDAALCSSRLPGDTLVAFAATLLEEDDDGRHDEDAREAARNDAYDEHPGEVTQHCTTEEDQGDHRQQRCCRGDDGARQGLVDRQVEDVAVRTTADLLQVLAQTVGDHDRVVQRVTDNEQHCGQYRNAELSADEDQEAKHDD